MINNLRATIVSRAARRVPARRHYVGRRMIPGAQKPASEAYKISK